MNELYKCVITPNVRTYTLRSTAIKVLPGPHWIVDGSGILPDRVIIPLGTICVESFSFTPDGTRIVHETMIPGVGTIAGPLPPPNARGEIELVVEKPPDAPNSP